MYGPPIRHICARFGRYAWVHKGFGIAYGAAVGYPASKEAEAGRGLAGREAGVGKGGDGLT